MPKYRILIRKRENTLTLLDGDRVFKRYPVATGQGTRPTPEGTFPIAFKTWYPSWTIPETGEVIPGGSPRNPLGSRWMGLGVGNTRGRVYGIHGTNHPEFIGMTVSSGCVRMYDQDAQELYDLVPLWTPVTIRL